MVPARFSRVGPSQNRSGERVRPAPARKINKNLFRRRLWTHFFGPGSDFARFWGPNWVHLGRLSADFRDFLGLFLGTCGFPSLEGARGGCQDRFWDVLGTLPGRILRRFSVILSVISVMHSAPNLFQVCPNFAQSLDQSVALLLFLPNSPRPSVEGAAVRGAS